MSDIDYEDVDGPDEATMEAVSEGVRELVRWLNKQGYRTTDSGDGSHFDEGMECAVEHPMIAIVTSVVDLVHETDQLYTLLKKRGVNFDEKQATSPQIQASYDPHDRVPLIILTNILSDDVDLT